MSDVVEAMYLVTSLSQCNIRSPSQVSWTVHKNSDLIIHKPFRSFLVCSLANILFD